VRALLPRLHYFQEGTCIVHHIFGGRVTEMVAAAYSDAYLTAHFEVGRSTSEIRSSSASTQSHPVPCQVSG
jgi:quinolinate synthase